MPEDISPENPELGIEFCGLDFNSPLVLLSGCVGFGDEYTRVDGFSLEEVGAVCLKGTTLAGAYWESHPQDCGD